MKRTSSPSITALVTTAVCAGAGAFVATTSSRGALTMMVAVVVGAVGLAVGVGIRGSAWAGSVASRASVAVLAIGATVVLLAVDVLALVPGAATYGIVLVVALTLMSGAPSPTFRGRDGAVLVLVIWGLLGSIIGRLLLGQADNALSFFLPLALVPLAAWRPLDLRDARDVVRLTRWLLVACALYVLLAFFVLVESALPLPLDDFKHERLTFVVMAVAAAFVLRRFVVLAATTALAVVEFLAYPALTWLVAVTAAALMACLARGRAVTAVALTGVLGLVGTVLLSGDVSRWTRLYFATVDKTDNSSTRLELLHAGLQRFLAHPVLGDLYTRNISVASRVTGPFRLVPVHNDYLQLAIGGGVVGVGLFLVWVVSLLFAAVVVYRRARRLGLHDHAGLALVSGVGIAAVLASAAFNPLLFDSRNCLVLALLAIIVGGLARAVESTPVPAGPAFLEPRPAPALVRAS